MSARAPLVLVRRPDDEPPLAIAGAFGVGVHAETLVDALLGLDDDVLRSLRGVRIVTSAGAHGSNADVGVDGATRRELVVVIGLADALPWRDGVRYLGVAAPGLYVPTTRTTSVPAALAADALARHLPAAWIDDVIVPLRAGLPLSRAAIVRGMNAAEAGP